MVDELVKIMDTRGGQLPKWSFAGEQHKPSLRGRLLVAGIGDLRKLVTLHREHLEECNRRGVDPDVVEDIDNEEDYPSTDLSLQYTKLS
jgi:hypothetical protein